MKPPPFDYLAPQSLDAALDVLADNGDEAKVLAGGQSLIPVLNFRLAGPALLVDINGLDELDFIKVEADGSVRIGALTRQRTVEQSSDIARAVPLLADAMPLIAHPQIRNRGTVGGSIAHADPAGELPVAMVALGAVFTLRSQRGERKVRAGEFFAGLMTTALAADEMLIEIGLPGQRPRTGWAFREVARRNGDYAHAGIAARLTLTDAGAIEDAGLVYLSAGDVPMVASKAGELLVGEKPTAELFAEAGSVASGDEIEPTDDIHATALFKRHLAEVLTRRALETALERARAA